MKLRLEAADEYMHPLEEASNFNESMYFNIYDPAASLGGFFRLGNRPNEGYAEMTACLYLPGGEVAFMFARPEIRANDAFDAGGMKFHVIEPFKALDVSYRGSVVLLKNPLVMAEPRRAFKENPWMDCSAEIHFSAVSPMYGGEPVGDDGQPLALQQREDAFARGHYEQHVRGEGTVRVGEREWTLQGWGLRDHSWGPRYWQAPWYYRWLTANFGEDFGFVVSIINNRDGTCRIGGMVLRGGCYDAVHEASIRTAWAGADRYHSSLQVDAITASGRPLAIEGRVLCLVPLRNRRQSCEGEELVTRICEGMTEWSCEGRTGYGLSEYLDQIVGGVPVGIAG